jgi:hypothetical protein
VRQVHDDKCEERRLHRRRVLPRKLDFMPVNMKAQSNGGPMIINLLAIRIPALLIAPLGVMKLSGNPKIAEEISKLGVGRYFRLFGVMEIAFAVLFVVPATMKLGFILASCYFGGAIATELSHDANPLGNPRSRPSVPFPPCQRTSAGEGLLREDSP